jgi:hypothetical protein
MDIVDAGQEVTEVAATNLRLMRVIQKKTTKQQVKRLNIGTSHEPTSKYHDPCHLHDLLASIH